MTSATGRTPYDLAALEARGVAVSFRGRGGGGTA